jgi:hypothetical protein
MLGSQRKTAKSMIFVGNGEAPATLELARRAISRMDGVFAAEANYVDHILTVEYDQGKVTTDKLEEAIEKARRKARRRSTKGGTQTP